MVREWSSTPGQRHRRSLWQAVTWQRDGTWGGLSCWFVVIAEADAAVVEMVKSFSPDGVSAGWIICSWNFIKLPPKLWKFALEFGRNCRLCWWSPKENYKPPSRHFKENWLFSSQGRQWRQYQQRPRTSNDETHWEPLLPHLPVRVAMSVKRRLENLRGELNRACCLYPKIRSIHSCNRELT